MISEIFGLFVHTLTADEKYSVHNREVLPQPIQMEVYKKLKGFPEFLLHT